MRRWLPGSTGVQPRVHRRLRPGLWCVAGVMAAVIVLTGVACSSEPAVPDPEPATTTEPPETTTTTEPPLEAGSVLFRYLPTPGDCFDRRRAAPDQGGGRVILVLDCATPHSFEVAGVFTVNEADVATTPDISAYPGLDALTAEARLRCPPLFADWVGTPYELSELEISWVLPEPESWAEGNRVVGCTVWDPATERKAGSVRDARR